MEDMSGIAYLAEASEQSDGTTHFVFDVPPLAFPSSLTASERDVASRIVQGDGRAAIAAARGVSLPTVNKQMASVFRKLNVRDRAELIAMLLRPAIDP